MILDNCIKQCGRFKDGDLANLQNHRAGQLVPFECVADHCPWNGCKFSASTVMHFVSGTTAAAKRDACRTANRSIGGCKLPPNLPAVRWPYSLSEEFKKASSFLEIPVALPSLSISLCGDNEQPSKEERLWHKARYFCTSQPFKEERLWHKARYFCTCICHDHHQSWCLFVPGLWAAGLQAPSIHGIPPINLPSVIARCNELGRPI